MYICEYVYICYTCSVIHTHTYVYVMGWLCYTLETILWINYTSIKNNYFLNVGKYWLVYSQDTVMSMAWFLSLAWFVSKFYVEWTLLPWAQREADSRPDWPSHGKLEEGGPTPTPSWGSGSRLKSGRKTDLGIFSAVLQGSSCLHTKQGKLLTLLLASMEEEVLTHSCLINGSRSRAVACPGLWPCEVRGPVT